MSEFRKRTITGLFFVLVLIFAIIGTEWTLSGLFYIFTIIGLNEFYSIVTSKKKSVPQSGIGLLLATLLYWYIVLLAMGFIDPAFVVWFIPVLVLAGVSSLYSKTESPTSDLGLTILGALIVATPFALLTSISMWNSFYDYQIALGFFIILWSNDTGAYLVGSKFGKRKLFERLSPKKSWEGFAGGVALCIVAAVVIAQYFEALQLVDWLVIAGIVAVFSNLGDLFESMLKRNYKVKDSGKIFPGHGGVLDRFDGLVFAIPMIYFYLLSRIIV